MSYGVFNSDTHQNHMPPQQHFGGNSNILDAHRAFHQTVRNAQNPPGVQHVGMFGSLGTGHSNFSNQGPSIPSNQNVFPQSFGGGGNVGIPSANFFYLNQANPSPIFLQETNPNRQLVSYCLPYIKQNLELANQKFRCGIHPAVMEYVVNMMTPGSPVENYRRLAQLTWCVEAIHNQRIAAGEIYPDANIDPTDMKEGSSVWCTNAFPEIIPVVEQILRDEMAKQQQVNQNWNTSPAYAPPPVNTAGIGTGYGNNFNTAPTSDWRSQLPSSNFRSQQDDDDGRWILGGMRDHVPPHRQQPTIIPQEKKPMIDTFSYVPTKEDTHLVTKMKSYCEERQLDFAPGVNHNQFNEVLEWCLEFREKIRALVSEGKIYLALDDREKYAHLLPQGKATTVIFKDQFEHIKREFERQQKENVVEVQEAQIVHVPKKEEKKPVRETYHEWPNTYAFMPIHPEDIEEEEEDAVVQVTEVCEEESHPDIKASSISLKRPVNDDGFAMSDAKEKIESVGGDQFLHKIEYDKLHCIEVPTTKVMSLKKDLLEWHKEYHKHSHGFKKGVGRQLVNILFNSLDPFNEEEKSIFVDFLVREFNNRVRVALRSRENPEKVFCASTLELIAYNNWDDIGRNEGYDNLKEKIWHIMDCVVNHWLLHDKAIITPEDESRWHVLLTQESDTFHVVQIDEEGKKKTFFKENLFLYGTQEEREEFVSSFMQKYTTLRIKKQMIVTNFLDRDEEEISFEGPDHCYGDTGKQLYLKATRALGKDNANLVISVEDSDLDDPVLYECIRCEKVENGEIQKYLMLKRI